MTDEVKEFTKTLTPITDFSTLRNGDKIFNRTSISKEHIDRFNRVEEWDDGRQIIYYYNYYGELWWGKTEDYWFYITA